ncbi:GNAT family N-acetyltransferase [Pedobacter sp. HMF7647]|uniref:GNAT family N-acetyltransferase n=1 Tax=Hufsiella arboris TaxID=2695275 RepID=A0A7K1YEN7_9SPHI|nr:GNAT family N-acetyltransferase [Hufsiella arboris]MXV52851.1 GNAT family N-acetyltransferase [Hufsiella arboris]
MRQLFRESEPADIAGMQIVRNSVKENQLSDPSVVPDSDVADYISRRGKGWVCEIDKKIVGFSIADLEGHSVWALFVHPNYEKSGIGSKLLSMMLNWYFGETTETIWLSTAPGTRAELFYHKKGWIQTGLHPNGETRFELSYEEYQSGSL